MDKCIYDPSDLVDVPLGQFHCPLCGEMVLAGASHPDYSLQYEPSHSELMLHALDNLLHGKFNQAWLDLTDIFLI